MARKKSKEPSPQLELGSQASSIASLERRIRDAADVRGVPLAQGVAARDTAVKAVLETASEPDLAHFAEAETWKKLPGWLQRLIQAESKQRGLSGE
jgi:hypothetical protein